MYQIHWPQPDEDIEEGWSAVAELIKEGKVRYAGVSNFSVAQLQRIQPIHAVTFLQPPYSMLNRSIEAELLPYCEENDIGIIAYSPMQKGLLSGKVTKEWAAALPADDHRRADPQFNEPLLSKNIALTKALAEIAHRYGRNSAELAIAWVLRHRRRPQAGPDQRDRLRRQVRDQARGSRAHRRGPGGPRLSLPTGT